MLHKMHVKVLRTMNTLSTSPYMHPNQCFSSIKNTTKVVKLSIWDLALLNLVESDHLIFTRMDGLIYNNDRVYIFIPRAIHVWVAL